MNRDVQPNPRHGERGVTLVEAMISMTLSLLLLLGMATLYESNQSTYRQASDRLDVQQNARFAVSEISRAIRMAGYFPENFSGGGSFENPIHVGTNEALVLHGDTNDDGTTDVTLFCVEGDTLRRLRTASASAAGGSYICVGGDVIAENVASLQVSYFDDAGNSIPAGANPTFTLDSQPLGDVPDMSSVTERGAVRQVAINLTTTAAAPPGKTPPSFTLGTVVEIRN